jgi:hypothetical protein
VRYGVAEQLYGADDLHAYRQGHVPRFSERRLLRREITVFDDHCATIMSEIELLIEGRPRANRQSQTWIKLPSAGWRIVAAHVSAPLPAAPETPPGSEASPAAWDEYVSALSAASNRRRGQPLPRRRPGRAAPRLFPARRRRTRSGLHRLR